MAKPVAQNKNKAPLKASAIVPKPKAKAKAKAAPRRRVIASPDTKQRKLMFSDGTCTLSALGAVPVALGPLPDRTAEELWRACMAVAPSPGGLLPERAQWQPPVAYFSPRRPTADELRLWECLWPTEGTRLTYQRVRPGSRLWLPLVLFSFWFGLI